MKRSTPLTLLTLVMFCLVTPLGAWGQAADAKKAADKKVDPCNDFKEALKAAQQALQGSKSKKDDDVAHSNLVKAVSDARIDLERCDNERKDDTTYCDGELKEYNETLKDYPHGAQVAANKCLSADEDDDVKLTNEMLMTMVSQTRNGTPGCDIKGTKSSYKDDKKDLDTKIEKLDEKMREADEDLLKVMKSNQAELDAINEERIREKEKWEETQEDSETAQTKALNNLRDKQLQLADTIRKLQTQEITARQNINSIEIEIKAAMSTAKTSSGKIVNLRSEGAIHLHCVAIAKQSNKENFGSGSSKNTSSGANRVKMLKEAYDNCSRELHDQRTTVTQSFMNSAEHRVKQLQDISTQLAETEKMYSQSVDDYNKLLSQLNSKLTKAQQKYYEKDALLADKYNKALERGRQNEARIKSNKADHVRKTQGLEKSQGLISLDEADEIMTNHNKLQAIYDRASERCPKIKSLVPPNKALEDSKTRREERESNRQ